MVYFNDVMTAERERHEELPPLRYAASQDRAQAPAGRAFVAGGQAQGVLSSQRLAMSTSPR